MRITSSMYYNNTYASSNSKLSRELFDVNRQISSGLKIQYAKDDVTVFTQTMRLDNEMTALEQAKKSVENGYKFSNQTDTTLNSVTKNLDRVKTLLIQAASAANDKASLNAIATELRGLEKSLKDLANTSINGQYLFSGSAVNTRPIAEDGSYRGNAISLDAFLGSDNKQTYNLTGAELFLGEESNNNREITTNLVNRNLLVDFAQLHTEEEDEELLLTPSSPIRHLMGDIDREIDPDAKHFFYMQGNRSDGSAFKEKIAMSDEQSVGELLDYIGTLYGNTPNLKLVNVTMNNSGQIVIEDKQKGSSRLDFHMVGAVDFSDTVPSRADVTNMNDLDGGETNFKNIINPLDPANPNTLFVKEFTKSGLVPADGAPTNIEGLVYDRVEFSKQGAKLTSNVPQILKEDNSFAKNSTKLSEVFSGDLNGASLKLQGLQTDGTTPYDIDINLLDSGSTFEVGGETFNFFNVDGSTVAANDMTYKQLMDVVNMAITGELPATGVNTPAEFHSRSSSASIWGETLLTHDGRMEFKQNGTTKTNATLSLYDANSGDFSANASVGTFNTNNALTVTDPKNDLFKSLNEIISSVEEYKLYPDADSSSPRGIGIQNAIAKIDDLLSHVTRSQTIVGAQSNSLNRALERTEFLKVSTMSLRSSVVDTDLAESSLRLTQLSLNFEAMLSTVGRISKLNLVNYL